MRRTERPGPAVPSPIARLLGDDDEGQLEPQNSIVLHSKLAGYRSSMAVSSWLCACCPPHIGRCSPNLHRHEAAVAALLAPTAAEQEPYFKTRQQRAAKAGDGGEMVQMRKKTAAMGRDFASLLSAHERQEASVGDLRQKVRTLRAELEQRDKALDLARRTVDRLNADKGQLEAGAAGGCCWKVMAGPGFAGAVGTPGMAQRAPLAQEHRHDPGFPVLHNPPLPLGCRHAGVCAQAGGAAAVGQARGGAAAALLPVQVTGGVPVPAVKAAAAQT